MDTQRFLLRLLAGVFGVQVAFFGWAVGWCFTQSPDSCPELGERYDRTFEVMAATIVGLLAGARSK